MSSIFLRRGRQVRNPNGRKPLTRPERRRNTLLQVERCEDRTLLAGTFYFQPDAAYLAAAPNLIPITIADGATTTSLADANLTVNFSHSMMARTVPGSWTNWGSPPNTESNTPRVLDTGSGVTTLTLNFSKPLAAFGLEMQQSAFGSEFLVSQWFNGVDLMAGQGRLITVPGAPPGPAADGAKLFGYSTDEAITRVVLTVPAAGDGFALAQVRYALAESDLVVTKSVSQPQANPGDTLQYSITLTNTGANTALNPIVSETIPPFLNYSSFQFGSTPIGWIGVFNPITGLLQYGAPSLAPGESVTFTYTIDVNTATLPGTTVINTATGTSDCVDPDPSDNTGSASVLIVSPVVTVNGTGGSDDFLLQRDALGQYLEVYRGGMLSYSQLLSTVDLVVVNGFGGNDTLTVNVGNGLLDVPGGIEFDGGIGNDTLIVTGSFPGINSVSYTPGPAGNEGMVVVDGVSGDQTITFVGLEPVELLLPTPLLVISGTPAADTMNVIVNGPSIGIDPIFLVPGLPTYEVNYNGAFELVRWRNAVTVDVNTFAGADLITVNVPTRVDAASPFALTTLNVDAGSDDDTIQVLGTAAGVTTNIDGAAGSLDAFYVGVTAANFNTGVGNLININGDLYLNDPFNDDVFIDDSGSFFFNSYSFDLAGGFSEVSGNNFLGTIRYDNFATNTMTFLGGPLFNDYFVYGLESYVSTTIIDGPGDSNWFVEGDNLFNDVTLEGGGGIDVITLFSNSGFTPSSLTVNPGGQLGDRVNVFTDLSFHVIDVNWLGGNDTDVLGLGTPVNIRNSPTVEVVGSGFDDLTFSNQSGGATTITVAPQSFQSALIDIDGGSPEYRVDGLGFFQVIGSGNDDLVVLGTSTSGLETSFEATSPDGSDLISVDDFLVTIQNAVLGSLLDVNIDTLSFLSLTVLCGNEAAPVGDTVFATGSLVIDMFIDGQLPALPANPGDTINFFYPGGIEIWRDFLTNNYVINGIGGGLAFITGFETINVTPGNGELTLQGDFNNVSPNPDYFEVDGTGPNSGFLRINDIAEAEPAISFFDVFFLTINGYEEKDTLDITPYASYVPPGWWGIDVLFDEGNPAGDLLIYNGVNGVSEDMSVVPSGAENGEFRVVNAGMGGLPLVTITYLNNLEIEVNANDGSAGDTDRLFLHDAAPSLPTVSGNGTFLIDFAPAAGDPIVTVSDSIAGELYRVNSVTNLSQIFFDGGLGNDTFNRRGDGFASIKSTFLAGPGNDQLVIDVQGRDLIHGAPIFFDGGAGFDSLTVLGTPLFAVNTAAYTPGPNPGAGALTYDDSLLMEIFFENLEPVLSLVPAANLIVNGNGADNTITYAIDPANPTRGIVTVDALEPITFANKTNLTLNGGAGKDAFVIQNLGTPAGLTGNVTVDGGSTGGQDTLTVYGLFGGATVNYTSTAAGTGSIAVSGFITPPVTNFTRIGSVNYIGRSGGDQLNYIAPSGGAEILFTPGVTQDSGTITAMGFTAAQALTPLTFSVLGILGAVDFISTDPVRNLGLDILGTNTDDVFQVAPAGDVQVFKTGLPSPITPLIRTPGVFVLRLHGQGSNDTFNVPGNHPFNTLSIDGGDPSTIGDVLNVLAGAGAITVNLGFGTVTEAGFGPIAFTAIERINVDGNAAAGTTVVATLNDDTISVMRLNALQYMVTIVGQPEVVADTPVTVDGAAGTDVIQTKGTEVADTIAITAASITINATTFGYANVEGVQVDALGGNDTVTVTSLSVATTIYGGQGDDTINASASLTSALIYGGDGNDSITGSQAADIIYGGDGNDTIIGGPGVDTMFGDAGSDTFIWNQGDADDLVEGGAGQDVEIFNGTTGVENFFISAVGNRVLLQRTQGGIDIDMAQVERILLNTNGGADTVLVNDLYTTDITSIAIDLFADLGAADTVTVVGRETADNLNVASPGAGLAAVQGLRYDVTLSNAEAAFDRLRVEGRGGDDVLKANPGVEAVIGIILDGGAGNDYLSADATLLGGDGNDTLVGGPGNDSLDGGLGDDVLIPSAGNDTLVGGGGFDIILIEGTTGPDAITVNGLANPVTISVNPLSGGFTGTNTISTVERIDIYGRNGNDTITATTSIELLIYGGQGNDTISALGSTGGATIYGEDGNDVITGSVIGDYIDGGTGNDTIIGDRGDDSLFGGDGSDTFRSTYLDGNDIVEGGSGNDIIIFSGDPVVANDFVLRNSGTRLLATLVTGANSASISAAEVEQVDLIGGTGADQVDIKDLWLTDVRLVNVDLNSGIGPDAAADCVCVNGRNVADDIAAVINDVGEVQVEGLKAQVNISDYNLLDTLVINGNAGNDHIAIIPPVLSQIMVQVFGGFGDDVIEGANQASGGPGNDTLIGTDGPDTLLGGPGDDLIYGLAGNDLLIGDADAAAPPPGRCCGPFVPVPGTGFGNDTIYGGDGNDTISGTGGDDSLFGGNGDDLIGIITVGMTTFLEPGNDYIDGGNGNDSVQADTGNDTVLGGAGNDALDGGDDDDLIDGQDGDDRILGGNGNDVIYGGAGNDFAFGGTGNDTMYGGDGSDTLCGEDGNDSLLGDAGGDLLISGAGNDFADGGTGSDTVFGGLGNDTLRGGDGDDFLFGNEGDDLLYGDDGDDVMFGNDGSDTLVGGFGNDSLYGGLGNDFIHGGNGVFRLPHHPPYNGPIDGNDVILGGDGLDRVDGGNGDNIIDAGDDDYREILLAGSGNDTGYQHGNRGTGPNGKSDLPALDGGHNRIVHVGGLLEPASPAEPPCSSVGVTVFNIGALVPPSGPALTDPIGPPTPYVVAVKPPAKPRATRPAPRPQGVLRFWKAPALAKTR
jgi:uncharacterized repeat protein (TIGR01451 family)